MSLGAIPGSLAAVAGALSSSQLSSAYTVASRHASCVLPVSSWSRISRASSPSMIPSSHHSNTFASFSAGSAAATPRPVRTAGSIVRMHGILVVMSL
ncbi:hypothetical protein [uncultured Fibrobacter sp.]|uniref:hypothetical protein n=1 Tax=uncultured Fibrobacter sp. TaxID=261512 RepID=UPI0026358AD3|nr:hypothetical protein [uncultured Fibrobacter sp.]